MILEKLVVGQLGANCYIVACEETRQGFVIDPGDEGYRIVEKLIEIDVELKYILNTHGHVDHIGGNRVLKEHYPEAKLMIHSEEADKLTDPSSNLSLYTEQQVMSPRADGYLSENNEIQVGHVIGTVIETPGHTPGGVSIKVENHVFTGDTLFYEGIGRCDLPGGDHDQLLTSIQKKLYQLPGETMVYPGHGPSSSIQHEKKANPFVMG